MMTLKTPTLRSEVNQQGGLTARDGLLFIILGHVSLLIAYLLKINIEFWEREDPFVVGIGMALAAWISLSLLGFRKIFIAWRSGIRTKALFWGRIASGIYCTALLMLGCQLIVPSGNLKQYLLIAIPSGIAAFLLSRILWKKDFSPVTKGLCFVLLGQVILAVALIMLNQNFVFYGHLPRKLHDEWQRQGLLIVFLKRGLPFVLFLGLNVWGARQLWRTRNSGDKSLHLLFGIIGLTFSMAFLSLLGVILFPAEHPESYYGLLAFAPGMTICLVLAVSTWQWKFERRFTRILSIVLVGFLTFIMALPVPAGTTMIMSHTTYFSNNSSGDHNWVTRLPEFFRHPIALTLMQLTPKARRGSYFSRGYLALNSISTDALTGQNVNTYAPAWQGWFQLDPDGALKAATQYAQSAARRDPRLNNVGWIIGNRGTEEQIDQVLKSGVPFTIYGLISGLKAEKLIPRLPQLLLKPIPGGIRAIQIKFNLNSKLRDEVLLQWIRNPTSNNIKQFRIVSPRLFFRQGSLNENTILRTALKSSNAQLRLAGLSIRAIFKLPVQTISYILLSAEGKTKNCTQLEQLQAISMLQDCHRYYQFDRQPLDNIFNRPSTSPLPQESIQACCQEIRRKLGIQTASHRIDQ